MPPVTAARAEIIHRLETLLRDAERLGLHAGLAVWQPEPPGWSVVWFTPQHQCDAAEILAEMLTEFRAFADHLLAHP